MHPALVVTLRHLLVQDAAPGGHQLQRPRPQDAPVAQTVAMLDRAGQHIGDRLDPPVRVPGEPGQVIARPVAAEIVEQQERVSLGRVLAPEGAVQVNAGAFQRGLGAAGLDDGTDGHGCLVDYALR